jgi:hypothetical protein
VFARIIAVAKVRKCHKRFVEEVLKETYLRKGEDLSRRQGDERTLEKRNALM